MYSLAVTVMGRYRKKRPMHWGHFLIFCATPSELSFMIHAPKPSVIYQQTPSGKAGKTCQEMAVKFDCKVFLSYSTRFFNMPEKHGPSTNKNQLFNLSNYILLLETSLLSLA
jgi:hypothetical protein